MEKLPPIEKIYEAWSAVADGRVDITADSTPAQGKATVVSSDGTRRYTVTWTDGGSLFTSNDNATYWQGYAGYPIIAVLMLLGRLPYDRLTARRYSGVDWNAVNSAHGGNYGAALAVVEEQRAIPANETSARAKEVRRAIGELPVTIRRGSLRPPR